MVAPMDTPRFARLAPLQIVALALTWPLVIVCGTIAYVAFLVWRDTGGKVAAVGFGWGGSPLAFVAALAVLVLPPAALLALWRNARSRPS
jgi:hypothetical protein